MTIKKLINRITQSGLAQDQQGAVLPLVGLAFIVMMLAAGFAIDYTRVQIVRERLQWAVDAATLAGAKVASSGNLATVQSEANAYFRANFPVGYMNTRSGTPRAEWVEPVNGRGQGVRFSMNDIVMENYVMDALGLDDMQLSATAEVNTLPIKPLDVVFSVDLSGSMQVVAGKGGPCVYLDEATGTYPANCYSGGNSKLTDAKSAMRSLLNQLHSGTDTRFGVVGWSSIVNIYGALTGNPPYATCDGGNRLVALASGNKNQYGQGNADVPPMTDACREFTPGTIQGSGSVRPMRYLTNNRGTVDGVINSLRAEANTDGALGMLWAYNMYRANPGWVGWRNPSLNKSIVLLTDGDNTKHYRTPGLADAAVYGEPANQEQIQICNQAKNAGINVYTIAYDMDNSIPSRVRGKQMLRECASRVCPNNPQGICYFDARNAADLNRAMETIGNTMMTMRLTK